MYFLGARVLCMTLSIHVEKLVNVHKRLSDLNFSFKTF
jgi:hypothetical protein